MPGLPFGEPAILGHAVQVGCGHLWGISDSLRYSYQGGWSKLSLSCQRVWQQNISNI